jgi:hypothetical protein
MVIAIDFDGTCVSHEFPKVGQDIGAVPILKKLITRGDKFILFTMRCDHPENFELKGESDIYAETGNYLTDAVNWFKENDIPLWGIQTNPTQKNWTISPKCYADLYIDDAALGCPLIWSELYERPYVDWKEIEKRLEL